MITSFSIQQGTLFIIPFQEGIHDEVLNHDHIKIFDTSRPKPPNKEWSIEEVNTTFPRCHVKRCEDQVHDSTLTPSPTKSSLEVSLVVLPESSSLILIFMLLTSQVLIMNHLRIIFHLDLIVANHQVDISLIPMIK